MNPTRSLPGKVDQYNPESKLRFRHAATEQDIINGTPNNPKRPGLQEGELAAALKAKFDSTFTGTPSRGWFNSCSLSLSVFERGWSYSYIGGSDVVRLKAPVRKTSFSQVRYGLPNLKTNVVTTSFAVAPDLSEEDRVTVGGDINGYFTDAGAYKVFAELIVAVFKPIISGAQSAVPAETLVRKMVEAVVTTALEKSLSGELEAKQFANAVLRTYLKHVVEGAGNIAPFDRIAGLVDKWTLGNSDWLAGKALDKVDLQKLEDLLRSQCRFDLVHLWSSKVVAGGIAIVDKCLGKADVILFLPKRNQRPAVTVIGSLDRLPEEGQRPNGMLAIAFAPVSQ